VSAREKIELLGALAEAEAKEPARANGQFGLVDLKALAKRVFLGLHKPGNSFQPITGLKKEKGEDARSDKTEKDKVTEPDPAQVEHEDADEKNEQAGAEVGFLEDEEDKKADHKDGEEKGPPLPQATGFFLQVKGQEEDEADFGQLRRLETDVENLDPSVRPSDGGHEETEDKEKEGEEKQSRNEKGVLEERFPDGEEEEEHGDAGASADELLDEKI